MSARCAAFVPDPQHHEEGGVDGALVHALRALDSGQYADACELAQAVLLSAKTAADLHLEAKALSCLAHCDRVAQRHRRASETARRAAELFQRVGDNAGETLALNTLSHACMLLGRNDEAIEAAMLCVTLSDSNDASCAVVVAHNCLGMAFCWSGNFEKAKASLETAVHLASRCEHPTIAYQPTLNQLWVEAARLVDGRYQTGRMGGLERMSWLVRECRRFERSGGELNFMPGMFPVARTVSVCMKGLFATWSGRVDIAHIYAERAVSNLSGSATWLDALTDWVLAELAWAQGDWKGAEEALMEMLTCAISVEHEQVACLAHLLLIQVFELQGKTALAKLESRALRARERRMASESMTGRETVAKRQVGARQSERHLEQALQASKQFERWSLEDALTGIANRRAFEQALAKRLVSVGNGRPLTVAMVDLDQFKLVNDTYTHLVGDRVLKTVASLLAASVRGLDLAARLAGDEFVVLFSDADTGAATEICERLRSAISDFDWYSIARGLKVTVSIGVSQAVVGDTVETVLHRSDKSMYFVKPGWVQTNFSKLEE